MKYLFDINVLLALAHQDHADHLKVSHWFRTVQSAASEFLTCSITELGFIRISVQAGLEGDVASAQRTLVAMKKSSKVPFTLCPDAIGSDTMPKYVKTPSQLTDGHLLILAGSVGAKLATLDRGIPGALQIV